MQDVRILRLILTRAVVGRQHDLMAHHHPRVHNVQLETRHTAFGAVGLFAREGQA